MTLLAGDLTTPQRFVQWYGNNSNASAPVISQLVSSMSRLILTKLSRSRLYSQQFVRTFNGQGTSQLQLPDYPATSITQIQMGSVIVNPAPLPAIVNNVVSQSTAGMYGYRFIPWSGNLPGEPALIEFVNGMFWPGYQNIKVTYDAGYLISNELWTVPTTTSDGQVMDQVTVFQPLGIWCRDNGIVNTTTGMTMTPVTGAPAPGQYQVGPDSTPGLYTFNDTDVQAGLNISISYSFVPADLEEAANQMVAERYLYRDRVGIDSKVLGGQETIRYSRGGYRYQMFPDLPPEVDALISPYVSVISPAIGADT
jgi:hypothetical protein